MLQAKPDAGEPEVKWLFCYGTLRDDSIFERLTQSQALPSLPATLQGWTQFKVPGAAYPGAVPSRFSDTVNGVVRPILTASDWEVLDNYESTEYLRVPCVVQTAQGSVNAQIYRYDLDHNHRIEYLADHTEWQRTVNAWFAQESLLFQANLSAACRLPAAKITGPGGVPKVFVSLLNEVPVGSARLFTQGVPEHNELMAWLSGVYIVQELRHLGLGTLVVEATIEKARQSGIRELYLYAEDRPQFFEHLGWRTLRAVRFGGSQVNLMYRSI